jgi:hypothetical protein
VTRTTAVFDRGPAEEFLLARGAGQHPHPGGTLHEHLLRVTDLLAAWGADRHLQAAGLCHACYGTDGYDQPLLALAERPVLLALAERPVLAALIGARAESLVYLYGSCDRAALHPLLPGPGPVPFRDRFTGRTVTPPEPDICAFTELTARQRARHHAAQPGHGRPARLCAASTVHPRPRAADRCRMAGLGQLTAGETPRGRGNRELRHPPDTPSNVSRKCQESSDRVVTSVDLAA